MLTSGAHMLVDQHAYMHTHEHSLIHITVHTHTHVHTTIESHAQWLLNLNFCIYTCVFLHILLCKDIFTKI